MEYGTVLAPANEDLAPRAVASKTSGNHLVNGLRLRTFNGTLDLMGVCSAGFSEKIRVSLRQMVWQPAHQSKRGRCLTSAPPAVPVPL